MSFLLLWWTLCCAPAHLSPEAREYIDEALSYMEEGFVNRDLIDWTLIRNEIYKKANGASLPSETYDAIRFGLTLLQEDHSLFITPEEVENLKREKSASIDQIEYFSIGDRIGYIRVPCHVSLSPESPIEYASKMQKAIQALDEEKVDRWVIDLRGNGGGDMWPMILGLGPLLKETPIGFFANGRGTKFYEWIYDGKSVKCEDHEFYSLDAPGYQLKHPYSQIAVLIDHQTASGAEAVAIAFCNREKVRLFGSKTYGLTTANGTFFLSDKAMLGLPCSYLADHQGKIYKSAVTPDELFAEEGPAVLNRAIEWLKSPSAP